MSAATIDQQTERQRLMAELYADLRAGLVVKNSTEWHRRRSRALRADPAILERKRAAEREAYRRNSKRKPWAQYVEDVRRAAEERRAARDAKAAGVRARKAARAVSYRSQMAERAASDRLAAKRMSHASSEPKIKALKRAEVERIEAIALSIREAERGECVATTMRGGFRVACIARGDHGVHVGAHGDRWN